MRKLVCQLAYCLHSKARFPLRKILAKCEMFLAKNSLLLRTKLSPVLCEKLSLPNEKMIWPIRMQLMTHYRISEVTEASWVMQALVLIQNWPRQFLQKRFCKNISHRVEIEERKNFLRKHFARNISLRIFRVEIRLKNGELSEGYFMRFWQKSFCFQRSVTMVLF